MLDKMSRHSLLRLCHRKISNKDCGVFRPNVKNACYRSIQTLSVPCRPYQPVLLFPNFLVKSSVLFYSKKVSDGARSVMHFYEFEEIKNKNKKSFTEMILVYDDKFPTRKGVVDFIYAALKSMEEFGVHKDLETYKKLIDLMPKGRYVATNRLLSGFYYHIREQDCIIRVLCQMEQNGVIPDVEMSDMLVNIFGNESLAISKYRRMMYWMPKFKNLSPFEVPNPLPNDMFTLGKLAIERITNVDLQTEIAVFRSEEVEAAIDNTWIVSGQSPTQKKLLQMHDRSKPVIVEGGDHVYIRNKRINYFTLKSEDIILEFKEPECLDDVSNLESKYFNPGYKVKREPTLHEQEDGIIYAVCTTGTSSKDSLLSWIRLLQEHGNPILQDLAVLFRFKKPSQELVPHSQSLVTTEQKSSN